MYRDIYSGTLKLYGEENESTLREAFNYAASLFDLQRCEEAKVLLRKMIPVARGVLGENHEVCDGRPGPRFCKGFTGAQRRSGCVLRLHDDDRRPLAVSLR